KRGQPSKARAARLSEAAAPRRLAGPRGAVAVPHAARAYPAGSDGITLRGQGPELRGTAKQQARQILAMGEEELSSRSTYPNAWFPVVDLDARRSPVARVVPF